MIADPAAKKLNHPTSTLEARDLTYDTSGLVLTAEDGRGNYGITLGFPEPLECPSRLDLRLCHRFAPGAVSDAIS